MRRSMVFAAAPLAALALCACQPTNDAGAPASEPADAPPAPAASATPQAQPAPPPADLAGDLDARGTEPFWGLAIRSDRIVLTRPDHPELLAPNPGPKTVGETVVWETAGAIGLTVTLWKETCSDGMSDLVYPLTATVRAGTATLKGCGAKTGAMPREGGA